MTELLDEEFNKAIILSQEQIKRLLNGESKFEMGICNAPYNTSPITREEYLLSKKEVDKNE